MKASNYINSKTIKIWIVIVAILELISLPSIIMTDSVFMKIATPVFILFCSPLFIALMYSLESAIYTVAFVSPLLPLFGYVFVKLHYDYYQWIAYVAVYLTFMVSLFVHKKDLKLKVKYSNLFSITNVILLLMFILSILNIIFAYFYPLTLQLFMLCYIPPIIYFFIISILEVENKKRVIKNVTFFICLGTTISAIPDLLYFIYLLFFGDKFSRLFGPLGSNFLLSYLVMIYPVIITNYLSSEDDLKKYYKIMMIINAMSVSSQFSRGIFFTLIGMFALFLIFDMRNYKIYTVTAIIVLILVGHNVFQRPDVQENITIVNNESKTEQGTPSKEGSSNNLNIIDESKISLTNQSRTRRPIWNAAINITLDYPILGVGNGNFKFFYDRYSTTKTTYGDAHNLVLTLSSEMGIPFALLFVVFILQMLLVAFYRYLVSRGSNKLKYLGVFIAISCLIAFGNVTGFALQNSREVHSYVPTFILIFITFYFKSLKSNNL